MFRASCFTSSSIVRSICLALCFALVLSDVSFAVNSRSKKKSGGNPGSASATQRTQGPPSPNLPNLNEARRIKPGPPKAPNPVPATKCRHRDKACKKAKGEVTINQPQFTNDSPDRLLARVDNHAWSNRFMASEKAAGRNFSIPALDVLLDKHNRAILDSPIGRSPRASHSRNRNTAGLNTAPSAALGFMLQTDSEIAMARIDPNNRKGAPGEDLLSRNFNWNLSLLSLPGRGGLDLGFGISYNSLVFTRVGNTMQFDPDQGDPTPGFQMGFPTIQRYFFNSQAGAWSYLLVLPSGRHVELRQTGTNVYESVDSSYLRLTYDPNEQFYLTLRTSDGTQLKFVISTEAYKCFEIKDRNGNYITINYGAGFTGDQISTIVDTLGRVITFNYDGFAMLTSITQTWGGQTHTWATFAYGTQTIQTNFQENSLPLTLVGVTNGANIPVLKRFGLADGSVYSFEYNTYCQVKTIRRYAPNTSNPVTFPNDYFQRAYTTYNLPDNASAPQTDCPRFTTRTDWAYEWNSGVVRTYAVDSGGAWGQVTLPDNTIYKEIFATSGWQRGLPTQTETWSGGVRKKWTTLQWTQDNVGLSYLLNPRVAETNVYDDAGNRRRTTISYTSFGLPSDVYEYAANATTVLRRTHTDYNLNPVYTSRRIIGLPSAQYLYEGSSSLVSKADYQYDLGGEFQVHQGPPIRHDTTNYGSSFVQGRGNLNSTRRWDATDPNNVSKAAERKTGYNTSGSVIFNRDPLNHQTNIGYTDSFSDGVNRNTFAYPTTITDADSHSSVVQYNFDFGAVTRKQDPKGAAVTRAYDAAGRIDRVTNVVNGAYTRYVYALNQYYAQTFTTINDLNPANEFYSITLFDGHDRVRATASDHPTSVGQHKAQYNAYDVMGRLIQQSNQTEINSSWGTAGDDAAGWAWSYQAYDWQGRLTLSTDQGGKTKEIKYGGCGCAGGQEVVTRDEIGRRQKITYDILGRLRATQTLFIQPKTQELNGDGDVYTATINTYNVRDQITRVRTFQGPGPDPGDESCPAGVCEETTMSYDGHARLETRKYPVESVASSYIYNADDTLLTMTDARGATATYGYNNRHLPTSITYGAAGSVIPLNPVTFGYDSVGKRLWMDDGPGRVDYQHNTLSQLEWEERRFDGLAQVFRLSYEYNLAGQLKKMTDPWNASITYTFNRAGQVTSATGNAIGQVYGNFDEYNNQLITQFAANVKYRAWGGLKSFTNGDIVGKANFALNYDTRLDLTRFEAGGRVTEHSYYPDGRVQDVIDWYHRPPVFLNNFDRHYDYDHAGRLINATAGSGPDNPYSLTYTYDDWNRTQSRAGTRWGDALPSFNANYDANGRDTTMTYDAAGNVTDPYEAMSTKSRLNYDAAGQLALTKHFDAVGQVTTTQQQDYDGDGLKVRDTNTGLIPPPPTTGIAYTIRSSVLGGKVIAFTGIDIAYRKVFIYLNGEQVAYQEQYLDGLGGTHRFVNWVYQEPVISSYHSHNQRRQKKLFSSEIETVSYGADDVFDPTGGGLELFDPNPPYFTESIWPRSNIEDFDGGCYVEGIRSTCDYALRFANSGGGRVVSIDPWFGLTPGVGPAGAIPVWDATGWIPGSNGDVGTHVLRLGFVFGFQVQQQTDELDRRTDCASFVDGLIASLARVEQSKNFNNPTQRQFALGEEFAFKGPANHDQSWIPTGWQPKYLAGGQNGAVYAHIYSHSGGILLDNHPVIYRDTQGELFLGTGRGASDHEFNIDKNKVASLTNIIDGLERAGLEGTNIYVQKTREWQEATAENLADVEGRAIGKLFTDFIHGTPSSFKTYADLRSHIFNRLCLR